MLQPPNYRADCVPTFVSPADDWDQDKVAELNAATPDDQVSRLSAYFSGYTRGDLARVQDLLMPDSTPTRFVCRRLAIDAWARVQQHQESGQTVMARLEAIRFGVVAIEGDGEPVRFKGRLNDAQVDGLRGRLGDSVFWLLGDFVINASAEVSIPESFLA